MRPLLFSVGPLNVYGYGAMIVLGGVLSFAWLRRRGEKAGLKTDDDFWVVVNAVLIGGFLGGRLLFLFEYTRPGDPEFWRSLFSFSRGFSVLGAFAGVPLALWLVCRRRGLDFENLLDHVCVFAPFWHVFGRLGCWLAGCCHGRPTELPWGIRFTDPRALVPETLRGVPLHPAQLYEAAADLLIALWLRGRLERRRASGEVAAAYFIAYGALRFALEPLRGDTVPLLPWLSAGQGLGLALIAGGLTLRTCIRRS